jgi:Family of unknown function (DUF6221)
MDEWTAFVSARLDEDEAAAKAAQDVRAEWYLACADDPVIVGALREHVGRHGPARVLREVEALRAILTAYIKIEAHGDRDRGWIAFRFAVETLAEAWSDHPDYPGR